jgi:hypothetical protein
MEYGWILWVSSADIREQMPDDLTQCMELASDYGFTYLKLDCDASEVLTLRTYNWDE